MTDRLVALLDGADAIGASVLQNTTRKRVAIVTSGGRHLAGARLRHVGLPVPDVMVTVPSLEPLATAVAG